MSRARQYHDDATRAAAWRYRKQKEQLQAAALANQAQRLHQILQSAASQANPQATRLLGNTVLQTLQNLQRHFQPPE